MKRVRENRRKGRRIFARTAKKTRKVNLGGAIARGGIRL